MSIGQRIKELRNEKGLVQEELGKALNVGKSTISQYENDINKPDAETLDKIASIFDCTVDYLLGRTKKRTLEDKPISDPALDDLLLKVPDLTEEEKESLADHMKFAIEQIEKERQRRAKENSPKS